MTSPAITIPPPTRTPSSSEPMIAIPEVVFSTQKAKLISIGYELSEPITRPPTSTASSSNKRTAFMRPYTPGTEVRSLPSATSRRRQDSSRIAFQRHHITDTLTQLLAGLEVRNMLAWQRDRLTRLRVATHARRAVMQGKTAEATDLDTLTRGQRPAHHFQQCLHRQIDIVRLQMRLMA